MKKTKKLVVGNWKMHPETVVEAKKIATSVKRVMLKMKKTQVVVCAPYVYLSALSKLPTNNFFLGSQDAFHEPSGSYTGEVSFSQLPQFDVSFVIVGHSERRARGETDEVIYKKVRSVVNEGMTAILCVGEKLRDPHGEYLSVVKNQLTVALRDISKKLLDRVVVAYEPVWEIGGTRAMTPNDIHEMSIFIKKTLREMHGPFADGVQIIYGGSVTPENIGDIMKGGFVAGVLVGHESLDPAHFVHIIKIVENA